MHNIHHSVCGVIPPHILSRVAPATLDQMRELASSRSHTPVDRVAAPAARLVLPRKRRNVYHAQHRTTLPGKLVRSDRHSRAGDREVAEAWDGSGATYDFFAHVFGRDSIDGRGMRIDSTVHYSRRFDNAMWNGREMVYGDGDGKYFNRFTAAVDVIGHELTHGITQYTAGLGYSGQTGALNEHLSDAFGIMVKQYRLGQTVTQSDWILGAGLFTRRVRGRGIRSMSAPGTAYDDPVLGRDPQPAHMRDYVVTDDDNGGVHINSGIPNHAFYLAAMAIGGSSWNVPGKIWYAALTERLRPDADFGDFARATVDIAGELYGNGGSVQRIVAEAWSEVGLPTPVFLVHHFESQKGEIMSHDFSSIDQSFQQVVDHEPAAVPLSLGGRLAQLVKIYSGIKPLLTVLAATPLLPPKWHRAISIFVESFDAVTSGVDADFKAGKDL